MGKLHVVLWLAACMLMHLGFQDHAQVTAKSTGENLPNNAILDVENNLEGEVVININSDTDLRVSNPRLLNRTFYMGEGSGASNQSTDDEDLVVMIDYKVVSTGEDTNNLAARQLVIPLTYIMRTSNLDTINVLTKPTPSQFNTGLMRNLNEEGDSFLDGDVNKLDRNKYDIDLNVALKDKSLDIVEMVSLDDDVGKANDSDKWEYGNELGSSLDGDPGAKLNFSSVNYSPKFSKTNLDEVIDFVLQLVNNNLISRKRDEIPIPDIHKVFDKKVGSVTVQGKFNALQGYFKNLSTILRTGDVTVEKIGATLHIECALGLGTMQVGYKHYDLQVQTKSANGTLMGRVGANSISLKATMAIVGGSCKATLDQLKLERFKDIKVEITGLGAFGDLLNQITNWITEHFKTQIVSKIEKELNKAVMDTLGRFHCDDLL